MHSQITGKNIVISKMLNPAVWLSSKMPGKIGGLVNKAFGNSAYSKSVSKYDRIFYRVTNLKESIRRTEGIC